MDMGLIYVVEDDRDISEIESFALKNSGYDVQVYENGADFYRAVRERVPCLVLLDIMLPDESGLAVTKKLREDPRTRQVPIILVTAKTTELDKVRGLDMGADDYITKPFGVMELISRVKALLRRCAGMEEDRLLTAGKICLDSEKRTVYAGGTLCSLTYKEYELLKLLLQNRGIVMRRDVIMERIWDISFEGESRTLDVHVKTLRQKLGDAGALIRTVRNVGYKIE